MRLSVRASACLFRFGLLLALMLYGGGARAAQIDGIVGFGLNANTARFRDNSWAPLTIFLTGTGARGVGQLQVTVHTGQRVANYMRRVPLRDGNLNEVVRFTVLLNSNSSNNNANRGVSEANVRLLLDGRKLAEKTLPLSSYEGASTYNVLALTQDASGLPLQRKKLGLIHRGINPATEFNTRTSRNGINPEATLRAYITDPRALPGAAQAYEMMDAIVLGDLPLDALAEEQITALKLYVQNGGLLIIVGNDNLPRLKTPFFTEMLPINPVGIGSLNGDALRARYGERETLPQGVVAVKGTLRPGTSALFGQASGDTLPLISARNYGAGVVAFTSFDVTASGFRGWKGTHAFWRDLLRIGNVSPRTILREAAVPPLTYYGSGYTNQLADALAGQQAANTPSLPTVGAFVGLYILLLVPVSYFILKKLDKREYAWVTAPLLILGFTVASYAMALSIKGGMLTVNRVAVYEGAANDDHFTGYAQMTLYSPARASYDIALQNGEEAGRALLPSEIYFSGSQNLVNEITVDQDKTTTLRNATVRLWDKRSFETPLATSLGGPVEIRTEMVKGKTYRATITNRTRYPITDSVLLNGQIFTKVGDLAPGETKQVEEGQNWMTSGAATGFTLPANLAGFTATPLGQNRKITPEMTRQALRAALHNTMQGTMGGGGYYASGGHYGRESTGYGRAPNAFVGWFEEKTLDVRVNGRSAAGEQVNMIVAHLPIPQNAQAEIRAATNPFLRKPVLNLEEDASSQGGQP